LFTFILRSFSEQLSSSDSSDSVFTFVAMFRLIFFILSLNFSLNLLSSDDFFVRSQFPLVFSQFQPLPTIENSNFHRNVFNSSTLFRRLRSHSHQILFSSPHLTLFSTLNFSSASKFSRENFSFFLITRFLIDLNAPPHVQRFSQEHTNSISCPKPAEPNGFLASSFTTYRHIDSQFQSHNYLVD
jgi:hypothetical protein